MLGFEGGWMQGNETISSTKVNAIVSIISLMSTYFHAGIFTMVLDARTKSSVIKFPKIASGYNLAMGFANANVNDSLNKRENEAYLILADPQVDFSKIIKTRPKLITAIFFTRQKELILPKFLSELVVPAATSFIVVVFSESPTGFESSSTSRLITTGKCFRIYKPIPSVPSKIFPIMYYGGETETRMDWNWETRGMDSSLYRKEILNMTGVTITVAMASHADNKTTVESFLGSKNSFFWKVLEGHLGFRTNFYVEKISSTEKSITRVYLKLISFADGLGILPVISSERNKYLDFILTGLDSKYHLLVSTPKFVYSWQSILKPLSSEAWAGLGVAIVLITITLKIVAHKRNSTSLNFSSCFLTILGFVCCQGSANIPNNISGRLVCYTALLFSFSIYQFYTSNFYSLLSTKEVSLPFSSLEQLLAKRSHNLYVHPDTAIYTYILKSKGGVFKRLWDELLRKDPNHQLTSKNREIPLRKVCKGKAAVLGLPFQTVDIKELQCKLVPVNSGYFPTNIVTVVRKNFPFKSQFKFTHLRLLEGGLSHKFKKEFLEAVSKRITKTNVTNEPVSLEHVAFLIVFYGAASLLSLIILGLEILSSRNSSKSNKSKLNNRTLQMKETHLTP